MPSMYCPTTGKLACVKMYSNIVLIPHLGNLKSCASNQSCQRYYMRICYDSVIRIAVFGWTNMALSVDCSDYTGNLNIILIETI